MRKTILAAVAGALSATAVFVALLLAGVLGVEHQRITNIDTVGQPKRGPSVAAVYDRAVRGVVRIDARERGTPLPEGRPRLDDGVATGSGFVVRRDGTIVTNDHVVAGGPLITVRFRRRGKLYRARLVRRDRSADLAVVRMVDPPRLTPLPLGDSRAVRVGDTAIALGTPLGLERTLTVGVVSALERRIGAPDGGTTKHVLQTDAAINPGSSGGPLLDARGRVIGVNSQTGGPSIGYAVPVERVRAVLRARR
jgi:S1-C subfamily serine protease